MTLPQPTAFAAILNGYGGECPCCRRRFNDGIDGLFRSAQRTSRFALRDSRLRTRMINDTPYWKYAIEVLRSARLIKHTRPF
jgi:hypothetical protein